MHREVKISLFLIVQIASILFLETGCSAPNISSVWSNVAITIDGQKSEWDATHSFYDKENHVVLGFMNEEDNLYVYLSSTDRRIYSHLIFSGCTVWFDKNGGKEKAFGIHFPVGMSGGGAEMAPPGNERLTEDFFAKKVEESKGIVEIIDAVQGERSIIKMEDAMKQGINVDIDIQQGVFVYEMKVPLDKIFMGQGLSNPTTTAVLGIGFETEKMKSMGMPPGGGREPGGGGMPPGGFGKGPGGGMGGRPGGMPGGGKPPKDFEVWAKVTLATNN